MDDASTAGPPRVVPPAPFAAHHQRMLEVESGRTPALTLARGSRTITRQADLGALDWARSRAVGRAHRRAAL